ncbi:MAG: phosphopantothenoylcysteine decarboxylase [Candidatus Omnitrophica bacterium]|nr:phosphopantothenoylcysteine decarboxylase [Candidatus Omnitrophota bacterium]
MDKNNSPYKKILITAGPTRESLDPVRYISNYSTGKMGYEIARMASSRGHEVCLITGPVTIPVPEGVKVVNVVTAEEMKDAVEEKVDDYRCIIMTAAVSDFKPERQSEEKIKKTCELTINFVKNPDILESVKEKSIKKVGFALETKNAVENGITKLKNKELDIIVINKRDEKNDPFGDDDNKRKYVTVKKDGQLEEYKGITKKEMAEIIVNEVEELFV